MVSVDHPDAPPVEKVCSALLVYMIIILLLVQDAIKIHVNPSGFILSAHPGPGICAMVQLEGNLMALIVIRLSSKFCTVVL